jgi:hypothetical protein
MQKVPKKIKDGMKAPPSVLANASPCVTAIIFIFYPVA